MTSQIGQQISTNKYISTNKTNHSMKLRHLIKYTCEIIFFKKHAENETGRLVPDSFI